MGQPTLLVLCALLLGGCQLVVDFDRSLIGRDAGTTPRRDAGTDASEDGDVEDASADASLD
jgi:hypothetical protein